MYNTFDPDNVTKEDMIRLAKSIESYIEQLEDVMIIPEEIMDEYGKQIEKGIERAKKLVSKLKKGDKSVFKDDDD